MVRLRAPAFGVTVASRQGRIARILIVRCLRLTRMDMLRLWVMDVRYSSSKFLSLKMMDFMAQLRELYVMGQEDFDMDMGEEYG